MNIGENTGPNVGSVGAVDWKLNLTSEEYAILDTFESTGFAELINPNDLMQNQFAWDYCYREFGIIHGHGIKERDYDKVALHLYGYLCSQDLRMGNNITKLNYTALIPTVKYLLELPEWDRLRSISLDVLDAVDESGKHIAADVNVLLEKVIEVKDKLHTLLQTEFDKNPSDNLISTVLLGVLGCCPSYDNAIVEFLQNEKSLSGEFNAKSLKSIFNYCMESSFDGIGEDIRELAKESSKVQIFAQKYPIFRVFDVYARNSNKMKDGDCSIMTIDYDWDRVTAFIAREMNVNSDKLIRIGNTSTVDETDNFFSALSKNMAKSFQYNKDYTMTSSFLELVSPRMHWDHKTRIPGILSDGSYFETEEGRKDFSWWIKLPINDDAYLNYDIWSNIHYGYVGRRIGLPRDFLDNQQLIDGEDESDDISVSLGYNLFEKHPNGFSTIEFREYILDNVHKFHGVWQYFRKEE
ncbi:hypothetical protein FACS1894125_0780 [Actinomycetota bacterium]|nr:hypothetical protein FACS1894125_0780 [Actinomycetota bacterium]